MKKIGIKGPIIPSNYQWIYDWLEMEATSPKRVSEQIAQANNEDLEVEINSGGGSVFDASEIYTALKGHPGNVTVKIVGVAASAASVIAMAGNKVLMTPTGQMMIHNASTRAEGDYREMDQTSNFLKSTNQTVANAYSLKTGKSYDDLLSMMDDETWMTPQRALELNFIDEIMFDDGAKLVASAAYSQLLPQQVIDKIRNEFLKGEFKPVDNFQDVLTNKKEGPKLLTLEQLKNEHPDLYNQVLNEGREAGISGERQRLQAIDEISGTLAPELVNKAKYEQPMMAQDLALEALKADAAKGRQFIDQRGQEINNSGVNNVSTASGSTQGDGAQDVVVIDRIAAAANQKRNKGGK